MPRRAAIERRYKPFGGVSKLLDRAYDSVLDWADDAFASIRALFEDGTQTVVADGFLVQQANIYTAIVSTPSIVLNPANGSSDNYSISSRSLHAPIHRIRSTGSRIVARRSFDGERDGSNSFRPDQDVAYHTNRGTR